MQALRIDLDDLTCARLAPIARERGETIQELVAAIAASWHRIVDPLPRPVEPAPRVDLCRDCGDVLLPRRNARGYCQRHYMIRRYRGEFGPRAAPARAACRICHERAATIRGRCERCYAYRFRTGCERPRQVG